MSTLRRFALNSGFSALSQLTLGAHVVLLIAAARLLGDADYGLFSFALSLVGMLEVLHDPGISKSYLRAASGDRRLVAAQFSSSFWLVSGLATLVLLGLAGVMALAGSPLRTQQAVWLLAVASVLRELKFLARHTWRALDRFELETRSLLVERTILLAAGLAVLLAGGDALALAWAFAGTRAVDGVLTLWWLRRMGVRLQPRAQPRQWPSLIRRGAPLALNDSLSALLVNIDVVMMGWWRPLAEVGWYGLAARISRGFGLPSALISWSLFPQAAHTARQQPAQVGVLYRRAVKYLLVILLPVAAWAAALADPLLPWVFGHAYQPAVPLVMVLCLKLLLAAPGIVAGNVLTAAHQQRRLLRAALAGLGCNVAANSLLIPRWGGAGAAWATVLSAALFSAVALRAMRRLGYPLPLASLAWRPALLAAASSAVMLALKPVSVWLALAIGPLGYVLGMTWFGAWDAEERELLRHAVDRLRTHIPGARMLDGLLKAAELGRTIWASQLGAVSLRRAQDRRVRRLIRHAYAHVPYYRRLLDGAGVRPQDIRGTLDLQRVPVSTKADLLRAGPAQLTADAARGGRLKETRTSGSSGHVMTMWLSPSEYRRRKVSGVRHLFAAGNGGCLSDRMLRLGWTEGASEDDRRILPVRTLVDFRDGHALLEELNAFRPTVLHGYPSALRMVACAILEGGRLAQRPRLIFSVGELLDEQTCRLVEKAFGVGPRNLYGTTELDYVGVECAARDGLHLYQDTVAIQVVGRDGRPVASGQAGAIIGTNLRDRAMPIIRFDTGDVGRLKPPPCACGRPVWRLQLTQGRTDDAVLLQDGRWLPARTLLKHLDGAAIGLGEFQVRQTGYDAFTVLAVPNGGFGPHSASMIERRITDEVPGARVQVRIVPRIERGRTGKSRVFLRTFSPAAARQEAPAR